MRRSLETAAAELRKTRNRGGLAADYSGLKPPGSYPLQPGGSCATRPRRSERSARSASYTACVQPGAPFTLFSAGDYSKNGELAIFCASRQRKRPFGSEAPLATDQRCHAGLHCHFV